MDCSVCGIRSAVGSCAECHAPLCEECGIICDECGAMVCPKHAHKTRSGKQLCTSCYEERKARRAKRRASESVEEAEGVLTAGREEEAGEEEILTVSMRQPPPPWKLSLYSALLGVAVILLLLIFPSLRNVALSGETLLAVPYLVLIIPAIAIFWGIVGLVGAQYYENRQKNLYGILISVVVIVLCVVAVRTDPARLARLEAQREQEARSNMGTGELGEWRQDVLNKLSQPDQDMGSPEIPQ
jgi:hypothetical protein